jgi:hypothetical protein
MVLMDKLFRGAILRGGYASHKSRKVQEQRRVKAGAKSVSGKIFLTAMSLTDLPELDVVKSEVSSGNIIILRLTPLAGKSIEDAKRAVVELREFVKSIGGDIGRLGEERIVICPPNVKIRRASETVAGKC